MLEEPFKPAKQSAASNSVPAPPASPVFTPLPAQASPRASESLLGELNRKKAYIFKAFTLTLAFWLVQFLYQYYVLVPNILGIALVRSFALAGATLVGVAILIGPLAVVFTRHNFVYLRRTFGVAGFFLIFFHVFAVLSLYFKWDLFSVFSVLNPFANFALFGVAAFLVFVPLFLTSTDWAIRKMSFAKWKALHRLVYFGFVFSILHFVFTNTTLLYNVAGFLLVAVTLAALLLELAAFVKKMKTGTAGKGAWVGAAITIFALVLFVLAFLAKPFV